MLLCLPAKDLYPKLNSNSSYYKHVGLGDVMVIILATGPKVRGFIHGREREFLRAIKIHSTTSFGGKVKRSAPCHKILRHVKNKPMSMKDTGLLRRQHSTTISHQISLGSLLGVSSSIY
jgi:hypothetical protein